MHTTQELSKTARNREIARLYAAGDKLDDIAHQFGVSTATAYRVGRRITGGRKRVARGAYTQYSDDQINLACEMYERGEPVEDIARVAGIASGIRVRSLVSYYGALRPDGYRCVPKTKAGQGGSKPKYDRERIRPYAERYRNGEDARPLARELGMTEDYFRVLCNRMGYARPEPPPPWCYRYVEMLEAEGLSAQDAIEQTLLQIHPNAVTAPSESGLSSYALKRNRSCF